MAMNMLTYYVDEELRRIQVDAPPKEALFREEWHSAVAARPAAPRRVARWLGGGLVRAGERLLAWSAPASGTLASGASAPSHRLSTSR